MSTYIDKNALINRLYFIKYPAIPIIDGFKFISIDDAINLVLEIPDADVIERKKGKWIEEPNCWLRCSCCNSHHPHTSIYAIRGSNYCPECGADMRGDTQ